MLEEILSKNLFFKHIIKYRISIILYILIIFYIILITFKNQEKQQVEHFLSLTKFNNVKFKNKECRKQCYAKYENKEDLKLCKKYCNCKKTCNKGFKSKKCLKKCKNIKNRINITPLKEQKNQLKKEIKVLNKDKKKKDKINDLKKDILDKKKSHIDNKSDGYFTYLINNYLSNEDKTYIFDINKNMNNFMKDCKNVFQY